MGAKAKQSVLVLVALVLALSISLAGCGKSANETASAPGQAPAGANDDQGAPAPDPVTLSLFIDSPYQQPTADNKIYKMIKDKTGVSLKMEFLVGDLQQKLGVMIAGNDYPDIMTGNDKLINASAFIPLEDLIEQHAPNLKKHYADVWNQIKDPASGHIYVLPNFNVFTGEFHENVYEGPGF